MSKAAINNTIDSITNSTVMNEEAALNVEPEIKRPANNTPGNLSKLGSDEFDTLFKKATGATNLEDPAEVDPKTVPAKNAVPTKADDVDTDLEQAEIDEQDAEAERVAAEAKKAAQKKVSDKKANPFEDLDKKNKPEEKVEEEETPPVEEKAPKVEAKKEGEEDADAVDLLELPPHTSPNAKEAFKTVKQSRKEVQQQLKQALKEKTDLEAKLLELEKAPKLPKEIEEELNERRLHQRSVDAEHDPEIKKNFDTRIESNMELIYSELSDQGMTPENIQKIKDLGGPDKIDFQKILEQLPPDSQDFIKSKRAENKGLTIDRKKAVEKIKAEARDTIKSRSEAANAAKAERTAKIQARKSSLLEGETWLNKREIPADASDDVKKQLQAENDNIDKIFKEFDSYVDFDTKQPEEIADIAAKAALAGIFHQNILALQAQNKALQAKLDAIKGASITKKPQSTQPINTGNPAPTPIKNEVNIKQNAGDSMDSFFGRKG